MLIIVILMQKQQNQVFTIVKLLVEVQPFIHILLGTIVLNILKTTWYLIVQSYVEYPNTSSCTIPNLLVALVYLTELNSHTLRQ